MIGKGIADAADTEFVYDCTDTALDPGIYYLGITSITASGSYYVIDIFVVSGATGAYAENAVMPASWSPTLGGQHWVGGILLNTVVS